MNISIRLGEEDEAILLAIECQGEDCAYDIYQKIYACVDASWQAKIDAIGGVYSFKNHLTYQGIHLENIMPLSHYQIGDGAVLEMTIGQKKAMPSTNTIHNNTCQSCGKQFEKEGELRYHTGKLAAQEWVYGITIHWQWTCCDRIIPHPRTCHHPKGCEIGLCKDCRPHCACYDARKRREIEEDSL